MDLKSINNEIKEILEGLDYTTLSNFPNISGYLEQSAIAFIIGSGVYVDVDHTELELRMSVASERRTDNTPESNGVEERNLEDLLCFLISLLHKHPIKGCKPCVFKSFEISPPQSGKWRALVLFTIQARLNSSYYDDLDLALPTKIIDRRYLDDI